MVKHAYGRCPTRMQLSTRPLVTGHIWRRNTPKVLKKWGKVIMVGSRRFLPSFWFWGGGQTIPWFFIFFPYLFYHRFLVSNCSKFCVKQMGSTVVGWVRGGGGVTEWTGPVSLGHNIFPFHSRNIKFPWTNLWFRPRCVCDVRCILLNWYFMVTFLGFFFVFSCPPVCSRP